MHLNERYHALYSYFLILFSALICYLDLNITEFNVKFNNYIVAIFILLFLFKIIMDNHSSIGVLVIISLFGLSFLIYWFSRDLNIMLDVSVIFAGRNIKFHDIIKYFFYVITVIFLITILASFLGLIPNITYVRFSDNVIRNSFGFKYPVNLSENILMLSITYFILNIKRRIKWIQIIILCILTYVIIHFTDTRMDYCCMIILIIIISLKKICPRVLNKWPFNWSWLVLPIVSILTIFFAYNYNSSNGFYYRLNSITEGRINYSNMALNKYGMSLLGQKIHENVGVNSSLNEFTHNYNLSEYFYIDQSIIRVAVSYGIVLLLLLLISYTYKMFRLQLLGFNLLVLLFAVIVIRSFFDVNLIQILGNPFLLILFSRLGNNRMLNKDNVRNKEPVSFDYKKN